METLRITLTNNYTTNFCKKIPITQGKITNIYSGEKETATLYEYDCTEKSDFDELYYLPGDWMFLFEIQEKMDCKHSPRTRDMFKNTSVLALQNEKNNTIGLAQIKNKDNMVKIEFIETDPEKHYKYAGQFMIASIGLQGLKNNISKVIIPRPVNSAKGFYTDKCGFTIDDDGTYTINADNIKQLIKNVENRTQSPILDLNA